MGGKGVAGSEGHCSKALAEYLSVTELKLGAWAKWVWKTFKVLSGSNSVLQSTGTQPAVHLLPVVFSELSSTNLTTRDLTSCLVRRLQRQNAERKGISSMKHHLDSDLKAKPEWATPICTLCLRRMALCSLGHRRG